jgi:hypothetical protein
MNNIPNDNENKRKAEEGNKNFDAFDRIVGRLQEIQNKLDNCRGSLKQNDALEVVLDLCNFFELKLATFVQSEQLQIRMQTEDTIKGREKI